MPGRRFVVAVQWHPESFWNREDSFQLLFDAPTAEAALRTEPTRVGYSQHEGAEEAAWTSPKLQRVDGTHPVVYPAAGSHANYFAPALYLGRSAAQGVGCDL